MKKTIIILLAALLFTLFGCTETEKEPEEVGGEELEKISRTTVYTVEKVELSDSVTADDGSELVNITVEYPVISNPGALENVDIINKMYADNAAEYLVAVKEDFADTAAAAYDAAPEAFIPYAFSAEYEITYNRNCFLSVKRDYTESYEQMNRYEIYADVYDMSVGLPLYADEIITADGEGVLQIIYLGFTSVAEEFPERFADNYTDILNSAIKSTEFYLTETGMVFVLQPGIATLPEYGCLTFEFPYKGNEGYFIKLNEK